jgi:hypothetical protein
MALTPCKIEALQWTEGSKRKGTLGHCPQCQVIHLQAFVLSLHPSPFSMTTDDWLALTPEQLLQVPKLKRLHDTLSQCTKA